MRDLWRVYIQNKLEKIKNKCDYITNIFFLFIKFYIFKKENVYEYPKKIYDKNFRIHFYFFSSEKKFVCIYSKRVKS
jgi:hypothetical protein